MKFLKLLLCLIAATLVAIFAVSALGVFLYRGTPGWYRPIISSAQETRDAANRADQKLLDLMSWAASVRAQRIRQLRGASGRGELPIGSKTITLSDEEINSFVATWRFAERSDLEQRVSRYFSDGRVLFENGRIILAGQSPDFRTLVSGEFGPVIDPQGNLRLDLAGLRAGRLPIPMSAVAGRLQRLRILLQQQQDFEQSQARIDPTLTANEPALASAWLGLLLRALDDRPGLPILVIPFDIAKPSRGLPVKLTAINVTDGSISLNIQPASPAECSSMLNNSADAGDP